MRSIFYRWAVILLAATAGCNPVITESEPGPRDFGSGLAIGAPVAKPVTMGTLTPPQGGTYFDLIAPPVSTGVNVHPLKARLTGDDRGWPLGTFTLTLTTTHVSHGRWTGTPVPAGVYTLTYLDEAGIPTNLQETVTVVDGIANYRIVAGIQVSPTSAVSPDRTGTQALAYDIAVEGERLKTVTADLGTVVDLPSGDSTWTPLSTDHSQKGLPLEMRAVESLVSVAWGSIQVKFRAGNALEIEDHQGVKLFGLLEPGVEYLLPADTQSQGCREYHIVFYKRAVDSYTRKLCSDGAAHVLLNFL